MRDLVVLLNTIISREHMGWFASHISPGTPLELGCAAGVSFQERLAMGLYGARKGFSDGDRVDNASWKRSGIPDKAL